MKIAIPIWEGRVSPVLDTARQLLIVDVEDGQETSRTAVDIPLMHIVQMARFVRDLGVDTVICGAISRQLEMMLATLGIRIIPWLRGEVDEVLSAHANGNLQDGYFFLPGCGRGRGRRGRRGRWGRGGGFGRGMFL
jgi:predicted Fe-Mo cluster-binding NifX family protein